MKVHELLEPLRFGTMITFQFENEARTTIPEPWLGDNFDDIYQEEIKNYCIVDNMLYLVIKA